MTNAAITYLQTPQAIRDRCQQIFDICLNNGLEHFACDLSQLDAVATYVVETTQSHYPNFNVPFHSRWRHFNTRGVDRLARLNQVLAAQSIAAATRSRLDLVVISVLLDAGAGNQWRYRDVSTEQVIGRSEGLAVASLNAFMEGRFSSQASSPYQVDALGLEQLTETALAEIFQVSPENSLTGLKGRLALLQRLGKALREHPKYFGEPWARPGNLMDYWQGIASDSLPADFLLTTLLESLGSIWPGRATLSGTTLGDVWPHPALPDDALGANLVPFHKLSQWLGYSMVEPLMLAGIEVTNLDTLTGLAEYRNGGLCIDMGLIVPKQADILQQAHLPSSPVIVEWRALTVILLDKICDRVRHLVKKTPAELPLIKVLEGGTWAAGRRIAHRLRSAGGPPIEIKSDGTVF